MLIWHYVLHWHQGSYKVNFHFLVHWNLWPGWRYFLGWQMRAEKRNVTLKKLFVVSSIFKLLLPGSTIFPISKVVSNEFMNLISSNVNLNFSNHLVIYLTLTLRLIFFTAFSNFAVTVDFYHCLPIWLSPLASKFYPPVVSKLYKLISGVNKLPSTCRSNTCILPKQKQKTFKALRWTTSIHKMSSKYGVAQKSKQKSSKTFSPLLS